MILRSGIDTIEISRLDEIRPAIRERFIQRVFTPIEIEQARERTEMLSGLFATKEAVLQSSRHRGSAPSTGGILRSSIYPTGTTYRQAARHGRQSGPGIGPHPMVCEHQP